MSTDRPDSATDADTHSDGIRTLLTLACEGAPDERLHFAELLDSLRQGAFGMFLLIAILPAFIPLPGVAGALSGPLVMLIGAQMLVGMRSPWLPRAIARRGPRNSTLQRFIQHFSRPLNWLDAALRPRLPALVETLPAQLFTGLQLIALGLLLSLPIPFTNYLFGLQLLLYALALLERDGCLMLLNWGGGVITIVFFSLGSGQLLTYLIRLTNDLLS